MLAPSAPSIVCPPPGVPSAQRKADEYKHRRLYRGGLSYRCGGCGKPKKGHVCDVPEDLPAGLTPQAPMEAALAAMKFISGADEARFDLLAGKFELVNGPGNNVSDNFGRPHFQ